MAVNFSRSFWKMYSHTDQIMNFRNFSKTRLKTLQSQLPAIRKEPKGPRSLNKQKSERS